MKLAIFLGLLLSSTYAHAVTCELTKKDNTKVQAELVMEEGSNSHHAYGTLRIEDVELTYAHRVKHFRWDDSEIEYTVYSVTSSGHPESDTMEEIELTETSFSQALTHSKNFTYLNCECHGYCP